MGTRSVHGEVAGISDHARAHFLEVKRARPLQDHLRDLPFAFADIGPQPSRNVRWLLHGKRAGRRRQGDDDDQAADDLDHARRTES